MDGFIPEQVVVLDDNKQQRYYGWNYHAFEVRSLMQTVDNWYQFAWIKSTMQISDRGSWLARLDEDGINPLLFKW